MTFGWKHKNILLLIIGIAISLGLAKSGVLFDFVGGWGSWSFLGAVLAGAAYASTFTATLGIGLFLGFSKTMSPFLLVALGAVGAAISDLLFFLISRNSLTKGTDHVFKDLDHITGRHLHLKKLFHTKYFGWTLPLVGAIMISSPLPDELGVSLLGISKMKPWQLIIISGLSHLMAMTALLTVATLL